MSRKILSIDVGIKNLSYVILEVGTEKGNRSWKPKQWGIIDLTGGDGNIARIAKKENLIKALKKALDDMPIFHTGDIDTVIIESQMKKIMCFIQASIMMYFATIPGVTKVKDIHAKNKLKLFGGGASGKKNYNARKKQGVDGLTQILIDEFGEDNKYLTFLKSAEKQDDLADCLLQCLWFIGYECIKVDRE